MIFFKGQLWFCLVVSGSPSGDFMLLCVDFSVLLELQKMQSLKLSRAKWYKHRILWQVERWYCLSLTQVA